MAGIHTKLAVTVYISSRYINNGLLDFSQNLHAGVGVVGVTMA
jgi:hypothetical protein